MKTIIEQINQQIEETRIMLKRKANDAFAEISYQSVVKEPDRKPTIGKIKTPPISYLLYGVSGVSLISSFFSESKILPLAISVASAVGGYMISRNRSRITDYSSIKQMPTIGSVRNKVTAQIIDIVKKVTGEWDDFMTLKQKEIQSMIASSESDDSKKDEMQSKTYIYEVIDISISDFSEMVGRTNNTEEIKMAVEQYKVILMNAIDVAVDKQIDKYKSLYS